MIEIENLSRDVICLPIAERHPKTNRLNIVANVIIGDAADKLLPEGVERGPRCPSPVVALTPAEWAMVGERNRNFVRSYRDSGLLKLVGDPGEPEPETPSTGSRKAAA